MAVPGQKISPWFGVLMALGAVGGVFGAIAAVRPNLRKERRGEGLDSHNCLQVGKGSPRLDVPKVTMCLTESQAEFLKPEKKIGCGVFACAYERADGKVVKITQDPTDVQTMIEGQDHPRIVKLYEARKLSGSEEYGGDPIYALVVEKLNPPSPSLKRMISGMPMSMLGREFNRFAGEVSTAPKGKTKVANPTYEIPENMEEEFILETCDKFDRKKPTYRKCRNLAEDVLRVHTHLGKKGIRLTDLHSGNFGVDAEGNWKILDVGFSKSPTPTVDALAGKKI